jgi:O-antigen/teichoic acid export membrane protein
MLLVSVMLGLKLIGVALCQTAFCLGFHVVQFIDIKRRYPELFPWWRLGTLREGLRNYGRALALSFNNVGQQLLNQGLVVLVSRILGSGAVPIFVATRTMVNVAQTANNVFIYPLTPEFGRLDAERRGTTLVRLLCVALGAASSMCLVGMGCAVWIAKPVFVLWTHGRLEFDHLVMFGFIVSLSFRLAGASLQAYQVSVNDLLGQITAVWSNVTLVVLLGIGLMHHFGLLGLAVAMICGEAVGSLLIPVVFTQLRLVRMQLWGSRIIANSASACAVAIATVGFVAMVFGEYRSLVSAVAVAASAVLAGFFWKMLPSGRIGINSM